MNLRFWLTSTSSTRSGWLANNTFLGPESGRHEVAVLARPPGHATQLVVAELLQVAEQPASRRAGKTPGLWLHEHRHQQLILPDRSRSDGQVDLGNLRPRDGAQISNPAHLIDVDAKVGTGADQAIRIDGGKTILGDQPIHQVYWWRIRRRTSSGRSAWIAIRLPGFSIRMPGMRVPFFSSRRRRTVALVSAAVPVNSVSPWLA